MQLTTESAKTTDRVYAKNGKNITINKSVTKQLLTKRSDYKDGNYAIGNEKMDKLFKFVADNTWVEWRLVGYDTGKSKKYVLMTTHEEDEVRAENELAGMKETNMKFVVHNHPGNCKEDQVPSGYEKPNYYYGDKRIADKATNRIVKKGGKAPKFICTM